MNFLEKRKLAKTAKLTIQQAIHVVNMRGDLMDKDDVDAIKHHAVALSDAMKGRDHATLHDRLNALAACLERHTLKHPVRGGALRENFEVLVVAIAVAMDAGYKAFSDAGALFEMMEEIEQEEEKRLEGQMKLMEKKSENAAQGSFGKPANGVQTEKADKPSSDKTDNKVK